jgi:3-methyladenine DNA glycosylase AlkD
MTSLQIIDNIKAAFEAHRNPVYATKMKAYMKDRFDFYGINQPLRKELSKSFVKELLSLKNVDLREVIHACWQNPERELLYVCMEYIQAAHKQWTPEIINDFEYMITEHSWWDTVDLVASNLVGKYFQKWYDADYQRIGLWNDSENLWLNRTAIIFQLKYKNKINTEILFACIDTHRDSKAFFHQKAIGWALRELAKTKPQLVKDFVDITVLKPLSVREALKHL